MVRRGTVSKLHQLINGKKQREETTAERLDDKIEALKRHVTEHLWERGSEVPSSIVTVVFT